MSLSPERVLQEGRNSQKYRVLSDDNRQILHWIRDGESSLAIFKKNRSDKAETGLKLRPG